MRQKVNLIYFLWWIEEKSVYLHRILSLTQIIVNFTRIITYD